MSGPPLVPSPLYGLRTWSVVGASGEERLAGPQQAAPVPGVVEARGGVELHREGFRAAQARPFALSLAPGANAGLIGRLAAAYDAEVVPAGGPGASRVARTV
jgi:hypothetical protein